MIYGIFVELYAFKWCNIILRQTVVTLTLVRVPKINHLKAPLGSINTDSVRRARRRVVTTMFSSTM